MKRVFADTFYFLALLNRNDPAHALAVEATRTLQGELVTTAWVVTELADALSDPQNRAEFVASWYDLRNNPQVRIVPPDLTLLEEAIQLFGARPDKRWSLTDCVSFVVMQREAIQDALTGDRHFEQAGFTALLKSPGA